MGKLGLLVIRHHIDSFQRHHRHQLGARLHILADPQGPCADRAVDRRGNLRVGQVQRRLLFHSAGVSKLGDGLVALGRQNLELLLGGGQRRLALQQLRVAGAERGVGLLGALHRAGPGLHQVVVTGALLLGELEIGFRCVDLGGLLLDDRLLQLDLGIEIVYGGLGGRDIGMGLIQRGPEIAVVDAGQELAGLNRLIVGNRDFRDVAGDLGRNDGRIGLYIGVIGRFQVAPGGEIVVAEIGRGGDAERQRQSRPPA